jgi:hypothetical protein
MGAQRTIVPARIVPFHQHLLLLGLGQQYNLPDRLLGIGGHALEYQPHVSQKSFNGRSVKQAGSVFRNRAYTFLPLREDKRQIKSCNIVVSAVAAESDSAMGGTRVTWPSILEYKRHLEQG